MTDRTESLQPEKWPHEVPPNLGPRRTEPRATAALVFGVLSVSLLPVIGPFFAILYGLSARRRITNSPDRLEGKGLADAGLALGFVGLIITIWYAWILYTRILAPPGG
jgi:uncharacterized protein DUF4190